MKTTTRYALAAWMLLEMTVAARAQGFSSGSTGALGALDVSADQSLDLPEDGILHYTTITVAAGATLRFNRNLLNTPVYLLAMGDVTIAGTIDVSGSYGTQNPPVGGKGGPGGFDGGAPAAGGLPAGAGLGPGAGRAGDPNLEQSGVGSGAHGTAPYFNVTTNNGTVYGTPLLVPMVGGSGGGGTTGSPGHPGGGGGGAIVVASSTRITLASGLCIRADGGENNQQGRATAGSGGGVRLVAPVVAGNGIISVLGGQLFQMGGAGRVRIDAFDRTQLGIQSRPSNALSLGSLMMVFPNPVPRLDIVDTAGTAILEGSPGPVQVLLPFGSSPERTVTVQARDFAASVPIRVVLTPENGTPVGYDAEIGNAAANPATAVVNVSFPINTVVHVHAWTR